MLKKRMKRSFIIYLLLVLLLLSQNRSDIVTSQISLLDSLDLVNRSIAQNYTVHNPIYATNDGQLAAVASNGTGTIADPFIIADWNISGSISNGIYISGTTKYFRIENCWISNSVYHGIHIDNVISGTTSITNNTCINNNGNGIYFGYSGSTNVVNNTCNSNDGAGIYLRESANSAITNNICNNNEEGGIHLGYSTNSSLFNNICRTNYNGINLQHSGSSTVTNNTCINNYNGIYISNSGSMIVVNNTCNTNFNGINIGNSVSSILANNTSDNNFYGIFLVNSEFSIITNNTFVNDGLVLWTLSKEEFFTYTISNNIVNNLPLGYFENLTDSTVTESYGQLILVNCNNTLVKDKTYSNTSIGIALYYCFKSILVNNTCNSNYHGIYLRDSSV
ncbi:MAG: right-handed parallel beta-helix repeat-containing protein, partial [Candidatus Hodarchaeota archaeon]